MREFFSIFAAFFKIGAVTFGGGYTMLAILQKDIVERRGWASNEDIVDYYAISQSLPGIIAVNTAAFVGWHKKRLAGLIAAALGVILPSLIIILVIAMFISNILRFPFVTHAFNGIRAAVIALIVDAAIKMWKTGVKDAACFIIFLAALIAATFTNISPVWPVIAGIFAGIAIKRARGGLS
ncbi:chromate transporter [Synergistales bacterium]|nr:chromate transporter [Synergistales bacterium]